VLTAELRHYLPDVKASKNRRGDSRDLAPSRPSSSRARTIAACARFSIQTDPRFGGFHDAERVTTIIQRPPWRSSNADHNRLREPHGNSSPNIPYFRISSMKFPYFVDEANMNIVRPRRCGTLYVVMIQIGRRARKMAAGTR